MESFRVVGQGRKTILLKNQKKKAKKKKRKKKKAFSFDRLVEKDEKVINEN